MTLLIQLIKQIVNKTAANKNIWLMVDERLPTFFRLLAKYADN